jgi:hypothetical protein
MEKLKGTGSKTVVGDKYKKLEMKIIGELLRFLLIHKYGLASPKTTHI